MKQVRIELWESSLTSPCWIWRGSIKDNGYGIIPIPNKAAIYAHRASYESLMNCKLDSNTILHHECKQKLCVNPTHLVKSTRIDHPREHGSFDKNGKCIKHPDSETYIYTDFSGGGNRNRCKACMKERRKLYKGKYKNRYKSRK